MNQISLRSFGEKDLDKLLQFCNNENIWNNVRDYFPHPYTEKDAVDYIEYCHSLNPPQVFAINYKDQLAGSIGVIIQNDVYRHSAELGFWIAEPYWGIGIASEAIKLIVKYAFKELKLERLFASVFDFNKASQKVLEKNGFQLESIAKKGFVKNGVIGDEYRYFLLKDD